MTIDQVRTSGKAPIIVVEGNGHERHFTAGEWAMYRTCGQVFLELLDADTGDAIATYAPGAWLHVRGADADAPDPRQRALGIARRALDDIVAVLRQTPNIDPIHPYSTPLEKIAEILQIAQGQIFVELEA